MEVFDQMRAKMIDSSYLHDRLEILIWHSGGVKGSGHPAPDASRRACMMHTLLIYWLPDRLPFEQKVKARKPRRELESQM